MITLIVFDADIDFYLRAKDADVTILSEVGLDPGIDHFLAMKCIDKTEAMGGKVVSFESWCGGLPAPQFADNPLRYVKLIDLKIVSISKTLNL